MRSVQLKSNKVDKGRALTSRYERKFRRGSLMVIEGETTTEMFIIRSGKVRILKQQGDSTVELAVLGPGSVIGELSLLDHQPRGATVQVVEDVTATMIDEDLLHRTLEKIPSWLANIINVVVKRLRDTMKRTSDDIVRKSVAGVIRVILLLIPQSGTQKDGFDAVALRQAKDSIYAAIGLGEMEAENVFLHLILKDMVLIRKDDTGREHLVVKDRDVLQMYMSFLRAQQRGSALVGQNLSSDTIEFMDTLMAAGEKSGKIIKQRIVRVGSQQVEIERERRGLERHVNMDALDELLAAKAVAREDSVTESTHGRHKRATLVYNRDTLDRIRRLHQWLPTFLEEVEF